MDSFVRLYRKVSEEERKQDKKDMDFFVRWVESQDRKEQIKHFIEEELVHGIQLEDVVDYCQPYYREIYKVFRYLVDLL